MNVANAINKIAAPDSRRQRFLAGQVEFWQICLRRLNEHNAMAMSASLAFRSIFAAIPALVLALLVVKSVGVLDNSKEAIYNLLDQTGVSLITLSDQNGEINAGDKILEMVDLVQKKLTLGTLGPIGVALLIWTALTLMITLETSLNRIYEAPQSRRWRQRFMMYWSILSLGPLVMILVRFMAGKITTASSGIPVVAELFKVIGWGGPVLTGILLLALLYKIMPNTRVSFRSALGGAIFVVPIWVIAKWAFKLYVLRVAGNSLYGAMGVIPLFLMWINLSWTIFLLGAEISHTAANYKRIRSAQLARQIILRPADMLAVALTVARPFAAGRGAVSFEDIVRQINLPDQSIHTLLERLQAMKVVCPVEEEEYLLARPAEKISVLEIMDVTPSVDATPQTAHHPDLASTLRLVHQKADHLLGSLTLADIIDMKPSALADKE